MVELDDAMVRVRLTARAVDGAANAALIALVAAAMDLPRRAVSLHAGHRARVKILAINLPDAAP